MAALLFCGDATRQFTHCKSHGCAPPFSPSSSIFLKVARDFCNGGAARSVATFRRMDSREILHLLPTETSGAFTPDCIPGQLPISSSMRGPMSVKYVFLSFFLFL